MPAPILPGKAARLVLGVIIVLAAGCTTPPSQSLGQAAQEKGLAPMALGGPFGITGYYRPGADAGRLHVYLDGDGSPWIGGRLPAADPTPRRPLALALLDRDPAAVLYLNRPCYGVRPMPAACRPALWTGERYSPPVVEALDRALDRARERLGPRRLVLMGYSGGGALALLLATERDDVDAVITVAANLDTAAWTRHHGYEPLTGSRNPAQLRPLPPSVIRWHLVGGRDRRVPPAVTRSGAAADPRARLLEYPEFDHVCCWVDAWPDLLSRLATRLGPAGER